MKSLCIKTNNSCLQNYLLNELKNIKLNSVCFSKNKFKHYENIIIHYTGNNYTEFYSKISSILSFLVIDELEDDLLKNIIFQNYFYFDSIEKNKILEICYDLIAENLSSNFDIKFKKLYDSFFNFISSHKSIILNGFINFRIKPYIKILEDLVDEAVNAFIIEKEYLEFISLLRLYINSQESNCDLVHLVYYNSDSLLLDSNKNIINTSSDIFNAKYLSDISFSSNDYTLNTLLSLIPKKIYIHLIDGYIDEFINTLKLVFENRINLCTDCNICKIYRSAKSNLNKTKKV